MLCGDLNGKSKKERMHVYIYRIHSAIQQKLIQHGKATTHQLKRKNYAPIENKNKKKPDRIKRWKPL